MMKEGQYRKTIKTIEYNGEIIPYYKTINGNIILITEPRKANDENNIFNIIQKTNPKNKTAKTY